MAFHNVIFPTTLKPGSKGGRQFAVDIYDKSLSGMEQRNLYHQDGRRVFVIEKGNVTEEQKDELVAFWNARKCRAHSFYYQEGPATDFESMESATELIPVRFNMESFQPEAAGPSHWAIPEIELLEVFGEDT